ncbi:D-dopachrome decarboxylase-like isoform X1 [Biomphalaria glabrata]|uniref:D-dopachrome decarboxylase n=1 Tax=Biomphalaria glabrata TaxID=6526 RepID=A0A9W2YEE5_BIOGL|nr:D-dopachrome decarboxylase-like isoform X1 [Biomphalaria glabrata]XP_055861058.1 D-dopachrome decarboxylase-like isoform X1 [Biomphalaria glabrata]XP_055861059.1 D-dopachrome decarboxylase-like isoform X1 [Biomphalaria glabrata]
MPLCYLYTNKKESELKDGIESRIANVVAEVLGKPLERMIITVVPNVRMFRQGNTEPTCTLEISAVGVFDAERNSTYSPTIKKLLQDELDLPAERCVIVYTDLDVNFVG